MVMAEEDVACDSHQAQVIQYPEQRIEEQNGGLEASGGLGESAGHTTKQAAHATAEPSSSSSQTSSSNNQNSNSNSTPEPVGQRDNGSSSTSKFKERRPRPIKIKEESKHQQQPPPKIKTPLPIASSATTTEEAPLDLSIKSAGYAPSADPFPLMSATTQKTTLETPRIIFDNDNGSLCNNYLLYTSSLSSATGQKTPFPSFVGDSPPITPNTPFFGNPELLYSPTRFRALHLDGLPVAKSAQPDSAQDPSQRNNHRLLPQNRRVEELFRSGHRQPNSRVSPREHRPTAELTPRRSSSTDNLSSLTTAANSLATFHQSIRASSGSRAAKTELAVSGQKAAKKASISPLATNNLTSGEPKRESAANQSQPPSDIFSYSPTSRCSRQPTSAVAVSSPTVAGHLSHSPSNEPANGSDTLAVKKSLTPTGIASATANFFNIKLNSPTASRQQLASSSSSQTPDNLTPNSTAMISPLSPFLNDLLLIQKSSSSVSSRLNGQATPTAIGDQLQRSSLGSSSSLLLMDTTANESPGQKFFHCQTTSTANPLGNRFFGSLASNSTSLNTPTLVSPNQLKSPAINGLIISAPGSPIVASSALRAPPSMSLKQTQAQETASLEKVEQVEEKEQRARLEAQQAAINKASSDSVLSNVVTDSPSSLPEHSSSSNRIDLSSLVTKAKDKMANQAATVEPIIDPLDDDKMDVDLRDEIHALKDHSQVDHLGELPKIMVSREQSVVGYPAVEQSASQQESRGQRSQRDSIDKRALSPQSFRQRVSVYHSERQESSSAPPDVYKLRAGNKQRATIECSCPSDGRWPSADLDQDGGCTVAAYYQAADQCKHEASYAEPQQTLARNYQKETYYHQPAAAAAGSAAARTAGSSDPLSQSTTMTGATQSIGQQPLSYAAGLHQAANGNQISAIQQLPYVAASGVHDSGANCNGNEAAPLNSSSGSSFLYAGHHSQSEMQLNNLASVNGQPITWQSGSHFKQESLGSPLTLCQQQFQSVSVGNLNHHVPCSSASSASYVHSFADDPNQAADIHGLHQLHNHHHHHQQPQYQQQPGMVAQSMSSVGGLNELIHQSPVVVQISSRLPSYADHQIQQQQQHHHHHHHHNQHANSQDNNHSLERIRDGHLPTTTFNRHHNLQDHNHHNNNNHYQQLNQSFGHKLHHSHSVSSDMKALVRSDSSCGSTELYFRSSSAAGGLMGHHHHHHHQINGAMSTRKYRCDGCQKAFTRSDMLTRHRRLHSGDKPFQCHKCKQEFSRSDHLSTHMRTHTGEKPYKCKVCVYTACRKDMITRHMKVHNRSSPHV